MVVVSVGSLMVGLGYVVAAWRVWWWWRDGVPLRVLLGMVPLSMWYAVTEHLARWCGSPSAWNETFFAQMR